jgi:hypothetical protein
MKYKCPYVINVRWTSTSKVLRPLLTNRKLVAEYMELKVFEGAPSSTWWLVAMVCDHYYSANNITFDALKRESSIVSKQYDNLTILMKELQMHSGACRSGSLDINGREIIISDNIISMGQFSVTVDGLKRFVEASKLKPWIWNHR